MSSPKMTKMFGRRPAGCCCCACAVLIVTADLTAEAPASVVPARSRLRRLTARSFELVSSRIFLLLLMDCSSFDGASGQYAWEPIRNCPIYPHHLTRGTRRHDGITGVHEGQNPRFLTVLFCRSQGSV